MKRLIQFGGYSVLGLLLAVASQPTFAQDALGDGRALDNNLQAGSGGRNGRVRDQRIDYSTRNDVITGNVTGSSFFRDTVDYAGVREFQDASGEADLFRFRANSAQSSIQAISQRTFGTNLDPRPVYSDVAGVTASDINLAAQYGVTLYRDRGLSGGFDTRLFSVSPGRLDSTEFLSTQDRSLGSVQDSRGRLLEVYASPFFGVEQRPVQDLSGYDTGLDTVNEFSSTESAIFGRERPRVGEPKDMRIGAESEDETEEEDDGRVIIPESLFPAPGEEGADEPLSDYIPGDRTAADYLLKDGDLQALARRPLGVELSALFTSENALAAAQDLDPVRRNQLLNERAGLIQRKIFDPLADRAEQPGDDPYLDYLRELQKRSNIGAPPTIDEEPGVGEGTDQNPPQDENPEQPNTDELLAQYAQLASPTDAEVAAADKVLEQVLAEYGIKMEESEEQANEDRPADSSQLQKLQDLEEMLSQDLPIVTSLAGNRDDEINNHLRDAENALAEGRYFDAERLYNRVLLVRPDYPLGRAGLVHAQLGAGLIRSAALNLRSLFAQHPELIGTRYSPKLLPTSERLEWARDELDGMINRTEKQEPALLLAYLGYQTGNEKLTHYGLSLAYARNPRDPIMPLLRKIWIDQDDATGSQAEQDNAEATPQK